MTIADRHPEAALAPGLDSPLRPAWTQWILHLANTVHPAFRLWFYPTDVDPSENIQAIVKDASRRRIEVAWTRIDRHLAEGGPYLLGATFSAADLLLLMFMRWSRNMPKPATAWTALDQFARRMKSRPSWKRLCEIEGLTEWA
jgi:glutathione S-transferase